MRQDCFRALLGAFVLAGCFLYVGCDNTVEPFAEEAGLFSVYGYLTLSQEKHFIRVKNLNAPAVRDSAHGLEATVTLENLETGRRETLIDSIVVFEGTATHNFHIEQDIQPETEYRLTVENPDGRAVHATATTPEVTEVETDPADSVAVDCLSILNLDFQNVSDPRLIRLSVGISRNDQWHWVPRDIPSTEYGILPWRIVEDALPDALLDPVDEQAYCTFLDDTEMIIAYTHFGPDWPPDSVLTDPTSSKVENGLGVFGALHRDTLSGTVDTTVASTVHR